MKVIYINIILLVFLIFILVKNNKENFTTYKRCNERKVVGILKNIFDNYNIKETKTNSWDIYIPCGYNKVESELKSILTDNNQQKIFGISGCDSIVSKNSLWNLLEIYYGRKGASKLMPETFIISKPNDMSLFKQKYNKNKIYVLKKNIQRKKGIKITNNLNEILNSHKDKYKVIQEFLTNTFTINKRVMNLRIYLFIVCKNNSTKIFIHKLGKCLYAGKSINNNKFDFDSRITNSYKVEKDFYKNNPLSLNQLRLYLDKRNYDGNKLFIRIIVLLKKMSKAIINSLCNLNSIKSNLKFQLFGIDVIFDEHLNPYILEINKGPDMIPKDEEDRKIKNKVELDMLEKIKVINISDTHYKNEFYKLYEK